MNSPPNSALRCPSDPPVSALPHPKLPTLSDPLILPPRLFSGVRGSCRTPSPHCHFPTSSGVSVCPLPAQAKPGSPARVSSPLIYSTGPAHPRHLHSRGLPPTPICLTRARLSFLSQRQGRHCLPDKGQAPQLTYSKHKSSLVNPWLQHLQGLALLQGERPGP